MRHALLLLALSSSAALPVHAQKDLNGCKTVTDADLKTAVTPHHASTTQTIGGQTRVSEGIMADGRSYIQYQGHWRVSPLTPADLQKQLKENVDSATVYTCKGTGAGAYHFHTESSTGKADGDVWVANGLITRVEEDVDTGDPGGRMHVSTKYDYSNVKAPPGV